MGIACIMIGRDQKCIQKFWPEILKGRDSLEELFVNGRIILKYIFDENHLRVSLCIFVGLVLKYVKQVTL
jgi:hypothetical protein